ncbi:uncharacterized protein PV06_09573 [Exophiala oligosperma]|uniref:C2H2-type domain-containing protein n=1 Tax=Exophiala oligosperma TaxID=215243 RepID=A0A0D2AEP0_9EURO|nr:uncharacterized protein PV06_09573 [Exophiala oligosperma]KIW38621.1 hypothetical protein PV06_09573 [Exophiala oligosperma]
MSSNSEREDNNPSRLIGQGPGSDDIIQGNLRAMGNEPESMRVTSSIINNTNSITFLPSSSFQDLENREQATRDSGFNTSSSDFTIREEDSATQTITQEDFPTTQTITQDAELIARRALESGGFGPPSAVAGGGDDRDEPHQTSLSVQAHGAVASNLAPDTWRLSPGYPQSNVQEPDLPSGRNDASGNIDGPMDHHGQHDSVDNDTNQTDLAIMEANRQHLLGLLDPSHGHVQSGSTTSYHPSQQQSTSYASYSGTTQNPAAATTTAAAAAAGTSYYGPTAPSYYGSAAPSYESYGSYAPAAPAYGPTSSYGPAPPAYGMMTPYPTTTSSYAYASDIAASHYQPPTPSYPNPIDIAAIDPNLALLAAYNRSTDPDEEDYSHMYIDIPAPNSTETNNPEEQEPVTINSRSSRPRTTRRKRKSTSDGHDEQDQTLEPPTRSSRRPRASRSAAAPPASAPAPAPVPAAPASAPGGPSLTASLNDPDIPSIHRRRQPSVVDINDPFTCHLCYHTCIRASTIREHYLSKHPELRLTKKNLNDYEPAKTANIKPLSFYKNLGLDTTYTGVDRKQVNARRRMDLGLRTTDPNYLRDVYKDTTAERTRQQRRRAAEEEEEEQKKKKEEKK